MQIAGTDYVVEPELTDGARPLFLFHKTGGDEHELLPLARQVAPGRARVGVRGGVLEDGQPRFFRRLSPGVFDEDSIRANAARIAQFTTEIRRANRWSKPLALGLSNGANIIAAILMTHGDVFSAAVLLRPAPPFQTPPPGRIELPVLIVAGRDDTTVPAADTARLRGQLTKLGAKVDCETVASGHRLCPEDGPAVTRWLEHLS